MIYIFHYILIPTLAILGFGLSVFILIYFAYHYRKRLRMLDNKADGISQTINHIVDKFEKKLAGKKDKK